MDAPMRFRLIVTAAATTLLFSAILRADSMTYDGNKYEGTINGIRNGQISMNLRGIDRQYDLDKVSAISLSDFAKFSDAEAARADDAKKAAALYKQVIPTVNKPELKQLLEWRA